MSIVTLFDKSFLQSLSLDESVWFDTFFKGNVCPMFHVETLADLHKQVRGRSPEDEVRILAGKFPEMRGVPNAYHQDLYAGELLGQRVPMDGRLLLAHGIPVEADGQIGVKFPPSPEAEAFSRWQREEFQLIERDFAARWRRDLAKLDLRELANQAAGAVRGRSCKSLEEARALAGSVVSDNRDRHGQIERFLTLLVIDRRYHRGIGERLRALNYPELSRYAPYAAHVLSVELFFRIALLAGLISSERVSNWVDSAYLFYLPFCRLFVSSDKLHRNCAPLFLRDDQEFVWGPDLKADLRALNDHYSGLPEEVKNEGLLKFAHHPPKEGDYLVARLWDRHVPNWRQRRGLDSDFAGERERALAERIRGFREGREIDDPGLDLSHPDFLSLVRRVKAVRGSWRQVPKDLE